MTRLRLACLFAGLLIFAAVAWAKEQTPNPHWLSDKDVAALVAGIPAPPAAGSDAEKADLQAEVQAEKTRTAARIAEAKLDANYSVNLFTTMAGVKITPEKDPVTFRFFDEVNAQIGAVVGVSKEHFKRLRPYLGHPDKIHPLFTAGGYSYPSGHATHAYAFALVLGAVLPDWAKAFENRAREIAQSRVDAGVHYTSDITEGETLGREVAKELLAKPSVQDEIKAVKNELKSRS